MCVDAAMLHGGAAMECRRTCTPRAFEPVLGEKARLGNRSPQYPLNLCGADTNLACCRHNTNIWAAHDRESMQVSHLALDVWNDACSRLNAAAWLLNVDLSNSGQFQIERQGLRIVCAACCQMAKKATRCRDLH